jgi:hypothetical protein
VLADRANDGRIRGRRGVALRERRLKREPLCRHCREKGIVREAVTPDHILPLAFGGTDTDDNVQCLCAECHAIKTAIEGAAHGGASFHPPWLKPSAVPVTIVCGPPCAGKTTYVAERRRGADTVIDLDALAVGIDPAYRPWEGMLTKEFLFKVIRVRNALLGGLSRQVRGNAWFIIAAPPAAERAWWGKKLGGEVVLLDPGREVCKARALTRGTPKAVAGVDDWHRSTLKAWAPPIANQVIGADGWPIES